MSWIDDGEKQFTTGEYPFSSLDLHVFWNNETGEYRFFEPYNVDLKGSEEIIKELEGEK